MEKNKNILIHKMMKNCSLNIGDKVKVFIEVREYDNKKIKISKIKKVSSSDIEELNKININKFLLLPEKDFLQNFQKKSFNGTVLKVQEADIKIGENLKHIIIKID